MQGDQQTRETMSYIRSHCLTEGYMRVVHFYGKNRDSNRLVVIVLIIRVSGQIVIVPTQCLLILLEL